MTSRAKRAIAIGVVAAVAGVVAWWTLGRTSRQALAPSTAEPDARAPLAQPAGAPSSARAPASAARADEQPPARADAMAKPSSADVLAILRSLELPLDDWPPGNGQRDFDHCDMSALKRAVERAGIGAEDLKQALGTLPPDDPLRNVALAAFAYVPDLADEERGFLLEAARSVWLDPALESRASAGTSTIRAPLAAMFALRMHGADRQLSAAAGELLQRHSDAPSSTQSRRDLALFAMSGIETPPGPELRAALHRVTAAPGEALLTSAAWQALARTGRGAEAMEVVQQAARGDGLAREGLEQARDPALIDYFEGNLRADGGNAYARWLAQSSAVALLDMPDERAFAAFERLATDPSGRVTEILVESLATGVTDDARIAPASLGAALALAERLSHAQAGSEVGRALGETTDRLCDEILRAVVPAREVQGSLAGLRRALDTLDPESRACSRSAQILAEYGDDGDRVLVERLSARLPEPERARVREILDRRRAQAAVSPSADGKGR